MRRDTTSKQRKKMNASYGTITESEPLSVSAAVENTEDERSFHFSCTVHKTLAIMLLALCYLIYLAHDILHKVRDRNVSNKRWPNPAYFDLAFPEVGGWSNHRQEASDVSTVSVLIVYGPHDDEAQQLMANHVAKGAYSVENTIVIQESVANASFDQVLQSDAVILGSSVENANTHPEVQAWLNNQWDMRHDLSSKVGGAFVTAGGISAGEEGTLQRLLESMMIFQMIIVGGNNWKAAFGASAITAEAPFSSLDANGGNLDFPEMCYLLPGQRIHEEFLSKAYGLGRRVAIVSHKLKGSTCA